jgi:hypothetical protein
VFDAPLTPEGIVTLSLDFLEELLLRKYQRALHILIFLDIKYKSADDPRLVDVDDVDI